VFDADRPITKSSQDRLDRSVFAKYLARCLLDHKDPDSLVVGLYGGWGAGKTSVINLVVEELNFAATNLPEDESPIVLNFSPWSYSGQHQLIYSFFRRLSSVLRNVPNLPEGDRIIHLLELYVSYFTQKPVPKSLRDKPSLTSKLISRETADDVYAWESGRDLTLIKAELNELLRNQKHKIVIIIDNISRLYDYEIKEIFQIVKSMGDYINTIYLLAFDKEYVVDAINEIDGRGGEEFLEKIVQLPFDIPPILQQDLEKIFSDRLMEIVTTVPEDAWNREYWADVYYASLKYFFENIRDITRYVNTLNFGYSRLRDVVNPVDFFALTALEVFAPDVYFGIRDNKDLFTDLLDNVYELDKSQIQKDKLRCEEIISRSLRIPHDILVELLIRLFPRIRNVYYPQEKFYHSEIIARKLKRICSPDLFDAYFRLSMQSGQIPYSEFETILALTAEPTGFDQAITRLNQDNRIEKFLDLLDGKVLQSIPDKNIQPIVNALLDNGDLFPQGLGKALSLDTSMRIHRIISTLLHRLRSTQERFEILQAGIAHASKSLFILCYELQMEAAEHTQKSDTYLPEEYRHLTPEQLHSLQQLIVSRIEIWAKNGSLEDHPKLLPILYFWRDYGDADKCRNYVREITNTDKGLVSFLVAVFDAPITEAMTEYRKTAEWEKYLDDVNAFIPVADLQDHARILFEDDHFEKLREREQLALMIFLDLIKAPTKKVIPKTSV